MKLRRVGRREMRKTERNLERLDEGGDEGNRGRTRVRRIDSTKEGGKDTDGGWEDGGGGVREED